MSCHIGKHYGMTAEVHGKTHVLDSQDGTGSFSVTLTGNGQAMNGNATCTGKWIDATLPGRHHESENGSPPPSSRS
jgi:hypothetical protein